MNSDMKFGLALVGSMTMLAAVMLAGCRCW
jgi:hypothetical protein